MRLIIERIIAGHPYPLPGDASAEEMKAVVGEVDKVRRYARGEDVAAGEWLLEVSFTHLYIRAGFAFQMSHSSLDVFPVSFPHLAGLKHFSWRETGAGYSRGPFPKCYMHTPPLSHFSPPAHIPLAPLFHLSYCPAYYSTTPPRPCPSSLIPPSCSPHNTTVLVITSVCCSLVTLPGRIDPRLIFLPHLDTLSLPPFPRPVSAAHSLPKLCRS